MVEQLQREPQVAPHGQLRSVWIPGFQRSKQVGVTDHPDLTRWLPRPKGSPKPASYASAVCRRRPEEVRWAPCGRESNGYHGPPAGTADGRCLCSAFRGLDQGPQPSKVLVCGATCRNVRDPALDGFTCVEHVQRVLGTDTGDNGSPTRQYGHEPVRGKPRDRLVNRHATQTQFCGDGVLVYGRTRRQTKI